MKIFLKEMFSVADIKKLFLPDLKEKFDESCLHKCLQKLEPGDESQRAALVASTQQQLIWISKTWWKMVIKSQLGPSSMKSQLGISGEGRGGGEWGRIEGEKRRNAKRTPSEHCTLHSLPALPHSHELWSVCLEGSSQLRESKQRGAAEGAPSDETSPELVKKGSSRSSHSLKSPPLPHCPEAHFHMHIRVALSSFWPSGVTNGKELAG